MRIVGSSPTASAANRITRREATIGSRPFRTTRSEQKDPVVQRQRLLAYNQGTMVRVHPGLLSDLGEPRASACGCFICLPEPQAGNAGPRRGVRPSPPPCHGGDRGFESHRGRFFFGRGTARYANRQSGEAQTFVTCGFDSHSCHLWEGEAAESLLFRARERAAQQELRPPGITHRKYASAGHWRAQVAVTHPPAGQCRFDSCPTHWSLFALSILKARRIWLVRLSAQDGGPSSRKGGFDSRTGHLSQKRETASD